MRTVNGIVEKRREKLLTDVGLVAHCMDHRFRGASLDRNDRARALRAVPEVAAQLGIPPPPLDEILEFIAERGIYSAVGQLDCHPYNVWDTVLGAPVIFHVFEANEIYTGHGLPNGGFRGKACQPAQYTSFGGAHLQRMHPQHGWGGEEFKMFFTNEIHCFWIFHPPPFFQGV